MTVHNMGLARLGPVAGVKESRAEHNIDRLDPGPLARRLVVFTPTGALINSLFERARKDIAGITSIDVIRRVLSQNPDSLWAIARKEDYDVANPVGQGFVALLMLNDTGLSRLMAGTFDVRNPASEHLVPQNEKPAGIYIWALHARGTLAAGISLVFDKISTPKYAEADLYARAATPDGLRFLKAIGFQSGPQMSGIVTQNLHIFRRATKTGLSGSPLYDSYGSHRNGDTLSVTVTVARSLEDITRVLAIRGAVYMAEQRCPFEEEFDGNDFSATHLVGYVGAEPAACLRIRYFADFAKVERLAVRKEFRNTKLAFQIARAAIELCCTKGYRRIYAHAQKRLLNFFHRLGFRALENRHEFTFSDFDYIEIVLDTPPCSRAITFGLDPRIINRPEGRWHLPLEHAESCQGGSNVCASSGTAPVS